ncbi:DUF1367 family protein, partial [Deltaproteobacteria bacterium]|nr:DUF1367 family protein [Deltaproteobacteria bacterium]
MDDPYFRKTAFNKLEPANPKAEESLKSIHIGGVVKCKLSKPRNVQHHRKFFALLNIVFENQEFYQSENFMLHIIKLGVGHGDWVKTRKHGNVFIPKSIS